MLFFHDPNGIMKTIFFLSIFQGQQLFPIYNIQTKMPWPIWINYKQSMSLSEVVRNDNIWFISFCKKGASLITCQQHPSLVPPIAMLSEYRYIKILCLVIAFCDDGYAISFSRHNAFSRELSADLLLALNSNVVILYGLHLIVMVL